jgi:glutamate---cysteine ligase / carboxylate-amine ligase
MSAAPLCPLPAFKAGSAFTVGVEEELHIVAGDTRAPLHATDALLEGEWPTGRATGEVCDGVVEFATPVCESAGATVETLRAMRAEAGRRGVDLLGAGLHPAGRFGQVRHRDGSRYALIAETMRGVMRQTPHCGVHVHVGMPDGETAVRACNGMRAWVPLLQALSANSPFWYGQDSGMASARAVITNSFPRSGIPRCFDGYGDFEQTVNELRVLGDCPDYSLIWWDVRPHPRLGTLEIRALDAQSSHEDVAALVALAHCLAVHEAGSPPGPPLSPEALRAMSFAATRDGLDARVPFDGAMVPARNAAVLALTLVGHEAVDLGCWDELTAVRRILERGNGADRQRAAAAREGLSGVLEFLVADTMGWPRRTRFRRSSSSASPSAEAVPAPVIRERRRPTRQRADARRAARADR